MYKWVVHWIYFSVIFYYLPTEEENQGRRGGGQGNGLDWNGRHRLFLGLNQYNW